MPSVPRRAANASLDATDRYNPPEGIVHPPPAAPQPRRGPSTVMAKLDAALFLPTGWFAIDARNQRVPGVVVASLEAGLQLVGRGPVATIVGRLRPEVVVVDVDLSGETGWAVTEALSQWCAREGLWWLVRPSGGAPGRCHVFIAPQTRRAALDAFLTTLRTTYRAAGSSIDLRSSVRPLCAPHRTGTHTSPSGTAAALAEFATQPWQTTANPAPDPARTQGPAKARTTGRTARRPPVAALPPARHREQRNLPPAWQHFLDTGTRPPLREPGPGAPGHTRSTWEAIATATMLRAGWDAEQAWAAIQQAHPLAMDHARADHRRWVRWVWNRAVLDDADYTPPAPALDPLLAAAIDHARTRLRTIGWSLPPRQRHAALLVGHALLDRMTRTRALRTPCPERDLVLDTGLTDRKTIRAQLRLLDGELGHLHRSFDPRQRETTSFEFEIPPAPTEGTGAGQIPPPRRHTPSPAALPVGTPNACSHLLRALQTLTEPATLTDVSRQAQLTPSPTTPLSHDQTRTIATALRTLAELGLAWCTETGLWLARDAFNPAAQQAGQARYDHLAEAVQQERTTYRNSATTAWQRGRDAALKANRHRQQAWWATLSEKERRTRTATLQAQYAALSVTQQAHLKTHLAHRDRGDGLDPAARHHTWIDGFDPLTWAHRCAERTAWYAALSPPLQVAYARAWQAHRTRFAIPRGTPAATTTRELDRTLPNPAAIRDAAFIHAQLPGLHQQRELVS